MANEELFRKLRRELGTVRRTADDLTDYEAAQGLHQSADIMAGLLDEIALLAQPIDSDSDADSDDIALAA